MMAAVVIVRRSTLTSSFIYKPNNASFSLYHYHFSTKTTKKKPLDTTAFCGLLISKHHFSPESASRVASALTSVKNLDKYDSILPFLKQSGFSNSQMERVLKYCPRSLSPDVENVIKPKIAVFQDLGLSKEDVAAFISRVPLLLHCSLDNRLVPSLTILKGLVGSNLKVVKVLKAYARVLATDLEKTLLPNIEFLKKCGVDEAQIIRFLTSFPRFLVHKPKYMRIYVERTDERGFSRSSGMFIYAARVIGSMTEDSWELKLKVFRDLGFTEDDIQRVLRNAPMVFATSESKIKKVVEVLLETGKYDMSSIVVYPNSLLYSVETRYKPRLHILGVLEKKNLIKSWPALGILHSMTDERFFNKFVAPYLDEVGELYTALSPYQKRLSLKAGATPS